VHSEAFLLPGIAADSLAAMQSATAAELQKWKVSKLLNMPKFETCGTFLLAPVSVQTPDQISAVLDGKGSHKVRLCGTSLPLFCTRLTGHITMTVQQNIQDGIACRFVA
jgi:hypothetical protein